MTMQLSELERTAYASGDIEKADIIAQLIQVREILDKLTESADSFATIIERASKDKPDYIGTEYAIINIEDDSFLDFTQAITDAQTALND